MTGAERHWVLIETGANQDFIFDSKRYRHAVGASQLVHELGTAWVVQAAGDLAGVEKVLAISGKALFLADREAAGRSLVERVSRRALREAPGLQVTGCVGPGFDAGLAWSPAEPNGCLTHVEALEETYRCMDVVRAARPGAVLRDPVLPWHALCADTGLPVAGAGPHVDESEASAPAIAKSERRDAGRTRIRGLLSDLVDVVPGTLDDLDSARWVAVVHADGNGVGQVFTDFAHRALAVHQARGGAAGGLTLGEHAQLLSTFADELDVATRAAFEIAVRELHAQRGPKQLQGTVLPVVVGGDDVTFACRADVALDLTVAFIRAFEEQTALKQTIVDVVGAGTATGAGVRRAGLTAAAGIAYIKPHHPFSASYALAEELTASAKRVNTSGRRQVSAVDFHVTFESTLAELEVLRAPRAGNDLPRHGGPYVVDEDPDVGPRDLALLTAAVEAVRGLPASQAHELRDGLALGRSEYDLRLKRAASAPDADQDRLLRYLAVNVAEDDRLPGEPVVRLLDAMLLETVAKPGDEQAAATSGTALAGVSA